MNWKATKIFITFYTVLATKIMKDRLQNSRIKFTHKDIEIILHCLNAWIKVDTEKYNGSSVTPVQNIVNFIKIKTSKVKNIYMLNLNCQQFSYIHNIVAEDFLQFKSRTKEESLNVCENVECVMNKNYKLTTNDILYPISKWKCK